MLSRFLQTNRVAALASTTALLALAGTAIAGTAATHTERVAVSSNGKQARRASNGPSLSHDGRFVTFSSADRTLVAGDSNRRSDVFVRDRTNHKTRRVSLSSTGEQGNDRSQWGSISGNGRFVAFESRSSNLAPGDRDHGWDVFVRDLKRNKTRLVSVQRGDKHEARAPWISADGRSVAFEGSTASTSGELLVRNLKTRRTERVPAPRVDGRAYGGGYKPSLSGNGRLVVFTSYADFTDPIPRGGSDVFVRDLKTHKTEMVSVSPHPPLTEGYSSEGRISADGRFVAFVSGADLVTGSPNSNGDIFRRDLEKHTTERIAENSGGFNPVISANGRFVAFGSYSTTVVPGDTNEAQDIFVHDIASRTTTRVSVSDSGEQGTSATGGPYEAQSQGPAISGDGRSVAFQSLATNLVDGDTNGTWDVFVRGPLRP